MAEPIVAEVDAVRYRIGVFAIYFAVACGCAENGDRKVTAVQAINIADTYVAKNYPMTPREILRPVAHDQGETWLITYEAPEGSGGGTPTIEVDKQTSRIVYAAHGQ